MIVYEKLDVILKPHEIDPGTTQMAGPEDGDGLLVRRAHAALSAPCTLIAQVRTCLLVPLHGEPRRSAR